MNYFASSAPYSSSSVSPTSSPRGSTSPSTSPRSFGSTLPTAPSHGTYKLSEEYEHLVEEPGMKRVIAVKIAKLQDSLPSLSALSLRQARGDIIYLRSIYDGEPEYIAQCKAGATYSASV